MLVGRRLQETEGDRDREREREASTMRQRFVNLSIDPSVSNIFGDIPRTITGIMRIQVYCITVPIIIPSPFSPRGFNRSRWVEKQRRPLATLIYHRGGEGGQGTPCNLAVGRGHSPGGVINNRPGVLRRARFYYSILPIIL